MVPTGMCQRLRQTWIVGHTYKAPKVKRQYSLRGQNHSSFLILPCVQDDRAFSSLWLCFVSRFGVSLERLHQTPIGALRQHD